jgi:hypothetical protein
LEYETLFRIILSNSHSRYTLESFIEHIAIPKSWGDEYCQIAISILFKKPLHTYSIDPQNSVPYSHEYCVDTEIMEDNAIKIAFILNHFVPLLAEKPYQNSPMPIFKQFKFSGLFKRFKTSI